MKLPLLHTALAVAAITVSGSASASDVRVIIGPDHLIPMSSPWADYFGTHYERSAGESGKTWNTVRSFGSPHIGIREEDPSAAPHRGPFTGREVRLSLESFQSPRGDITARDLLPQLIKDEFTAIYLMNNLVRPTMEPFDKDLAYWAIRQIHEAYPEATPHLVWQMGNEVVSGHFDPRGVWKTGERGDQRRPAQKEDNFFGYDLDWKEDYYVNDYLAPAIEATERVSQDLYREPGRIQIALGSMNPYNRQNIRFLANVMERRFDGRQASSLDGEPVWKHIDYLTVHYMTGGDRTIQTLQQYHDDYLLTGKIQGIWITEDHGHAGKGPVTILERGFRFLNWVATNQLDAGQARLCWWGEGAREPGGPGKDATRLLGTFLEDCPLYFSHQSHPGGSVYVLTDSPGEAISRGLIAIVPDRMGTMDIDELSITLPARADRKTWSSQTVSYSISEPAVVTRASLPGGEQTWQLSLESPLSGAWLLLFADTPDALP